MNTRPRWDIFCTVVDNYGDIGVCWRLARQLATEHDLVVRLWVDDLASFAKLAPTLDPRQAQQRLCNVEVRRWQPPFADVRPADVVIEAFACALPDSYIAAMAALTRPPIWINLEYLSAEAWVQDRHGLPSPHARLPLTKYFYFPGFTARTGGLIREAGLLDARAAFQCDFHSSPGAQAAWWRDLGIAPAADACKISLFAYPNAPIAPLLQAWIHSPTPIFCVLPDTPLVHIVSQALKVDPMRAGTRFSRGNLSLAVIPFLPQDDYDHLLWACNVNFVRGEDSFVRAQWAAKPFVWQIYPQQDAVHSVKLQAFLTQYGDPELDTFWRAWNGQGNPAQAWPAFAAALATLSAHAEAWALSQAGRPGLAANLVKFSQNPL